MIINQIKYIQRNVKKTIASGQCKSELFTNNELILRITEEFEDHKHIHWDCILSSNEVDALRRDVFNNQSKRSFLHYRTNLLPYKQNEIKAPFTTEELIELRDAIEDNEALHNKLHKMTLESYK